MHKNVSTITEAYKIGDLCRDVRIRSGSNRESYLDNLIMVSYLKGSEKDYLTGRVTISNMTIVTLLYESSTNCKRTFRSASNSFDDQLGFVDRGAR